MTIDPEPAGSPLTAVRRTSRGPSAGVALVAIVAAVAGAVGLAVVAGPAPAPTPSAQALLSASPPSSVAPSASAAVASPTPVPDGSPTVIVLKGAANPSGSLGSLTGCTRPTRTTTEPLTPNIEAATVDRVAAEADRNSGWIFVPPGIQASTRVWLGTDLVELARAAGQQMVAVSGAGEVWLGGKSGATRWIAITTPLGRTAWVMARDEITGDSPCGPWTVPARIDDLRSLTCTGVEVRACLQLYSQAATDVAGFAYGGDATVALAACRQRAFGCSDPPVVAVATPLGWPVSTATSRAARAPGAGCAVRGDRAGVLPDSVLDIVSRPALLLPTASTPADPGSCSETLVGSLRGLPWDPRVALIDQQAVVWPAGTSVWFAPDVIVETIGKTDGTTAHSGDRVELAGRFSEDTLNFYACSMRLSPATAGPVTGALWRGPGRDARAPGRAGDRQLGARRFGAGGVPAPRGSPARSSPSPAAR
ncbi:MAG: hypothetical protein U0838_03905 [Chloroflexota bacterium]